PILVGEEAITIGKKLSEIDKQNKSYYLEKSEQFNKKMKMIEKNIKLFLRRKNRNILLLSTPHFHI
ncbi:adhesion protein, partial [Enterococcus faecalis]|nr:adhesion protein [Enterococcus faecalis]